MKIFLLILVLSVMEPGGSAQELQRSGTFELSMMDESIDDMFSGCKEKMERRVQNDFFQQEIQSNPLFSQGWTNCAHRTMLQTRMQNKSKDLTSNHTRALCVYTNEQPEVYEALNGALRTGAANYNKPSFTYHALNFWLISAVQILKKSCQTTYRRTDNFYNGQINQKMRFGYFASSSLDPDLTHFGSETCFHIKTCLGAYIEPYSAIKGEEEVLIPPYEVFKVTRIEDGSYEELNCNKIFVLKSVGHKKSLNCKAANHSQHISANLTLILAVQLLIVLLWNNSIKL